MLQGEEMVTSAGAIAFTPRWRYSTQLLVHQYIYRVAYTVVNVCILKARKLFGLVWFLETYRYCVSFYLLFC